MRENKPQRSLVTLSSSRRSRNLDIFYLLFKKKNFFFGLPNSMKNKKNERNCD